MPQKKNPDAAELLRAKSPRITRPSRPLAGVLHALPLGYSKDLQEDKEALFDAADTIELGLEAAGGIIAGLRFDRERIAGPPATRWARRPRSPTCWSAGDAVPRGARRRRRAGAGGPRRGPRSPTSATRRARGYSDLLDGEFYEVLGRIAGSTRRSRSAGRRRPGSPSSSRRPRCALERGVWRSAGRAPEPTPRALGPAFFERSVHDVARELIGCALLFDEVGGVIVETESYERDDPACHAYGGPTPRTGPLRSARARLRLPLLWNPLLLNAVGEPDGNAAAVLVRALEPLWGIETMAERRGLGDPPARALLRAGEADRGARRRPRDEQRPASTAPRSNSPPPPRSGAPAVVTGPRIGIKAGAELPWRFCAAGSRLPLATAG